MEPVQVLLDPADQPVDRLADGDLLPKQWMEGGVGPDWLGLTDAQPYRTSHDPRDPAAAEHDNLAAAKGIMLAVVTSIPIWLAILLFTWERM